MRLNIIMRYVGMVMLLNAAFMLLSAGVSLASDVDPAFNALILSTVLTGAIGAFPLIFVRRGDRLLMKEGYVVVVTAWLLSCFVGMFPYLLWGGEFSLTAAWFESVSGYTTTGATALSDVEALPNGLLFWRSSTHWLGGVGVVMFAMVIVPALGGSKITLASVELSALARENYRYRTQKIIQILLLVYVGLTASETVLLKIAGMSWFDAVNHSFSTIATGGFSTYNDSIAHFDNLWIEGIITVFMILSGIHFGLLFATLSGKRNNIFRSDVTRFYLSMIVVATLLVSLSTWNSNIYSTFGEALRRGVFQVASIGTTTGFVTANTTLWTPFAIVVLMHLTFQCGCAGSTSGGIKTDRIWLALKVFRSRLHQQQHPNAVIRIKMGGMIQESTVVNAAMYYIVIYVVLVVAGTLVVTATGMDILSGFRMVATCMGNVGPGFGEVGSVADFSHITPPLKTFCTLFMLLGRLEIFGLMQLFMMKWWR